MPAPKTKVNNKKRKNAQAPEPNPGSFQLGLVGDSFSHFCREILLGAREWSLHQKGIRTRVISPRDLDRAMDAPETPDRFDAVVAHDVHMNLLPTVMEISPVVVLTTHEDKQPLPRVITDDLEVGREAAEYFLRRGFRSFACLHWKSWKFSELRTQGFLERLAEGDHPPPTVIEQSEENQFAFNKVLELPRPLAVFAVTDSIARRHIDSLLDQNIHVPREVAVLGVDDDPYQNSLCALPLSSVKLGGKSVGAMAAELAWKIARGEAPPKSPILVPPVGVASRLSTDSIACSDARVATAMQKIREDVSRFHCVEDLIHEIRIPRRTLEWAFREHVGHTIHEELSHARLQKARELLATTDLTANEITEIIGLSEGRMLSLLLRRMANTTPSAYRKCSRGQATCL